MEAAWTGQPDMVRLLLECEADASLTGLNNATALQLAQKAGHQSVIAVFAEFGIEDQR
jgi:ankyrin repeat protein